MGLVATKSVKVKMLPFDNKEEFQVLLDFPTSTPLLVNHEKTKLLAHKLLENPNVDKVQIFSGEPAPFSFSGMVKHTFMRRFDYQSDLQVVLKNKHERKTSSHDIIQELRKVVIQFSKEQNVISKVLEIPPGPPVMATIVAEVYGPSEKERKSAALEIEKIFHQMNSLVDVDSTLRKGRNKLIVPFDYTKGSMFGVSAKDFSEQAAIVYMESPLALLEDTSSPEEINVVLSFKDEDRLSDKPLKGINAPSYQSGIVEIDKMSRN
jgi:multidrug efflux pump subunit AcrB